MDDEKEIRALLARWATAVHAGDLELTLANHASDIVMFDVPPPEDGVRGIAAYRETWTADERMAESKAARVVGRAHQVHGQERIQGGEHHRFLHVRRR